MPLARHQKIPLLQCPLRTQRVFSFIDEICCLRNFPVLVYFVILEAIIGVSLDIENYCTLRGLYAVTPLIVGFRTVGPRPP